MAEDFSNSKNYIRRAIKLNHKYRKVFLEDQVFDGQNWVKICDVPDISLDVKNTKPGTPKKAGEKQPKKTKKMRAKRLVVVSLCVIRKGFG